MKLEIIHNGKIIKNTAKFILKNFNLIDDNEKMFIKYSIDKSKELRIFFKSIYLTPEKKAEIKIQFQSTQGIEDFLNNAWLVKSTNSGVLLFVDSETETSNKDGIFVITIGKSFFFPTPIYLKRSFVHGESAAVFYIMPKCFIFILGENTIDLIINNNNNIIINKYITKEETKEISDDLTITDDNFNK